MITYGLIGYPLSHSGSAAYFREKFLRESIAERQYLLFPLPDVQMLPAMLDNHPDIRGLNVTIPHKISVMQLLDEVDAAAVAIGAVNTIVVRNKDGKRFLKGFNTDMEGFLRSVDLSAHRHALILGTGGAARAVAYALHRAGIGYSLVSRDPRSREAIGYPDLTREIIEKNTLIVNATPLGMYPETGSSPAIPYHFLTPGHLLYDLVYNPPETGFMRKGRSNLAAVMNGLKMLENQAELSYTLWKDRDQAF